MNNIERFKQDLDKLIKQGEKLYKTMQEVFPTDNPENDKLLKFKIEYEIWYSESQEIVKQLLPTRLNDFNELYKKSKERKKIDYENYTISDALINLHVADLYGIQPKDALPKFNQQIAIVQACERKIDSSLFNIRHLLRADLFKNELDAA